MATLIDQILPVVAPTRSVADQPKATPAEGKRFQEHLERASSVEKPASSKESQEDQAADDDSGLALTAGQNQDSPLENNEAESPPVVSDESIEQIPEEVEGVVATDDITLSSAAVIAVESIVAGETTTEVNVETEVEIESVLVVQPHAEGDNLGEDAETALFATEVTEVAATDEIVVDEAIAEGEQKPVPAPSGEQSRNADSTNQADLVATSKPTDEVLLAEKPQQNVQASQADVSAETSGQGSTDLSGQPATGNGAFQQSPRFDDVEQDEANSEPTSETKKKATTESVNQLPALGQESTILDADAEPTPAANAATAEANTNTSTNTNSESASVLDKLSNRPSIEPTLTTAEARAETDPVPTADRARFVQRVSGAIRSAKDQDGLVQLKLSPPELGSLRIEISVKQGILTAKLETESAAARAVLLDNLPALRERLAEQEIRIEKFDVDVRDESKQQENPSTEDRNSNNSHSDKTNARSTRQSENQSNSSTLSNHSSASSDLSGGLDVMI